MERPLLRDDASQKNLIQNMGVYNILDADLSSYTVLVADDIELNLLMVKKMLAKYNFRVLTASDGQEAMDMIAEHKPALLLVDLMMPVLNGFEVISRVRSNPEYSSMRIVVLSALNASESIIEALTLGADEFIAKPITLKRLYDSVSKQFEMILAMGADANG